MTVVFSIVAVSPYRRSENIKEAVRRGLRGQPDGWAAKLIETPFGLEVVIWSEDGRIWAEHFPCDCDEQTVEGRVRDAVEGLDVTSGP